MGKGILKKINWEYFEEHPIVKAFSENLKEDELFTKNLKAFVKGDKEFRKKSGLHSINDEEILEIISYIKKFRERRYFLKTASVIAAGAAIAGTARQLGVSDLSSQKLIKKPNSRLSIKGICYDVGTRYTPTFITRAELNAEIMQRELRVIKKDLNCNAVRIYGEDIKRLIECSKIALNFGLQVWLSPRLINGSENEILVYIKNCAIEAEKLRRINQNIVFIVGNELTLDMKGLVPGDTYQERGYNLIGNVIVNLFKSIFGANTPNKMLNSFLRIAVNEIKLYFKGKITYASGNWEEVDWSIFDIIGINHYLNITNRNNYRQKLGELKHFKKPITILEFGCGSYKGAENKGGSSYNIVDWNKQRPEIKGNSIRDENVQAKYILDLLNIFSQEGLYGAFVYTFVETHYLADDDNPLYDLDTASFNIIKVYPDWHEKAYIKGHIIPKKSFSALANFYANH